MFSNNEKISSRQIKRLLVFDLFGVSSLLLPTQLAKAGNGFGLWNILAGTALAGLYLWLVNICCRHTVHDYIGYLKQGWGIFFARTIYICYAMICIFACGWVAKLLSDLMCDTLLENKEFPLALFFVILLAFYGAVAGLEARARIYEVMFWVLVIPLVVMLLLCIRQVQVIQWFPIFQQEGENGREWFLSGTFQCFAAFLPVTFLLFLVPHEQNQKKARRAAGWAVVISAGALIVIYMILLGIFGRGALAQDEYPVVTLMGMVKLPGDFLKRLDAVMVGVWFFTLYALIGSTLYYAAVVFRRACDRQINQKESGGQAKRGNKNSQKYGRNKTYWFSAAALAAYGIAYGFHIWPQTEIAAGALFYNVCVPFLVLVPFLSVILCRMGQNKNKKKEELRVVR